MRNTRFGLVFLLVFSVFTFGLSNPGNAVTGPTLTIQTLGGLTSLNSDAVNPYSFVDSQINHLRRSGFFYTGQYGEVVANTTFGSAKVVSEQPFKVRYTINKGRVWSDGVPITAADLLTHHIVCSTKYSIAANLGSPADSGKGTDFKSICYGGIYDQRVVDTPVISSDKLSITVEYDKFFPGWAQVSPMPFPAHALVSISQGRNALIEIAEANAAKAVFEKAVIGYDRNALLTYANTWSNSYNMTEVTKSTNPLLLVSNGGYVVESAVAGKSISLVYNEKYNSGPRVQGIARINYRVIAETTMIVQALADREVDLIEALPTADSVSNLRNLSNVKVYGYNTNIYEHLDLKVSASKTGGEPYSGVFAGNTTRAQDLRRAFLLAFPRQEIIDKVIKPITNQEKPLNSLLFRMDEPSYANAVAKNGINFFTKDSQGVREAQALDIVKKYFPSASSANPQVKVNLLWGNPSNTRRSAIVQMAKASLARAGFDLNAPGVAGWSAQLKSGNYDAAIFSWVRPDTAVERNLNIYCTDCSQNYMGYSDPILDSSLLSIQAANLSGDSLFNTFITAENQIYKNAWSLPLFHAPAAFAANSALSNFKPGMNALPGIWNYWELSLPGAKPFDLFVSTPTINDPTNFSFSGIKIVGNKINLTVNIGTNAAIRPDKVFLVVPQLGIKAAKPLAAAIAGEFATWSIDFDKSLSGMMIPIELFTEKNGVQSDPFKASLQAPTIAGSILSVPPTPTNLKPLIIGNSAVVTAEVKIKSGALATNAFLVSKDLGFTSARPLKGEVAGTKIFAEFEVKPSMAGKKYPVSIYATNSKGKSKNLEGMIIIPKAPSAPKTPTVAQKSLICVNKFNPNRSTTTDAKSCPVGWQEL